MRLRLVLSSTPCILIRCKCLSSKSSVLHTTYAVFEDKTDGKYLVNESNCSCKKGEHFCSHLIGFLYLVNTMQQAQQMNPPHSQQDFEKFYRVNPLCVQSKLMLIENAIIPDSFQQQTSQRKRQLKRRLYDEDNITELDENDVL